MSCVCIKLSYNCLKTSFLQLRREKSALNHLTWPRQTALSLKGLFPRWRERQQHQHELRLAEAVLRLTDVLALAKANSVCDFCFLSSVGIMKTKSWMLDSLLWGLREFSWEFVLTISYVSLCTGDSDSGWACSDVIEQWDYGSPGSEPHGHPGAMWCGGAVLTGDAFLLTCFLPQLAFKLFLSSGIGIVLFLFHCHRMRAACEHFPAVHGSDDLDWALFT